MATIVRSAPRQRRGAWAIGLVGLLVAAGCGSGESILDAGRVPAVDTVPANTDPEVAPTTTQALLEEYPACPADALDARDAGGGPVEVTFWYALSNEAEGALFDIVDRFHASQDRVRIDLQNQGGYNEAIQKYRQRSQEGRPDMVMLPEYMLQEMIDSDSIVPVGACMEESDFDTSPYIERTLDAYATRGIQWSMPFNVSNPILYYNKNALEAAGLDPEVPPRSLDELEEYSRAITNADGWDGVGIGLESGRDSGGGWFVEQWMAKDHEFFANNNNGRSAAATRVLYNNEASVDLLTQVQSMVDEGTARYLGNNEGATGFDQLFAMADPDRPTAMAIGSSAAMGTVKAVVDAGTIPGMQVDDLGVGPMPGPTEYDGALVGGASLYLMSDKNDSVTAAAWEFIQFATSAESQSAWAARSGYAPVRADATEIDPLASVYEEDPRFRVTYDQLTAPTGGDPTTNGPVLGPMLEIRGANARMTESILTGGDVTTELQTAAARADILIADYHDEHG